MKSSLPIFTIHLISISVIVLAVLTPCNGFAQLVPNITTQPQNQSVVASSNATFTVVASGQSPLSYQWSFAGTNLTNSAHISGVTASTLTISNVVASDAGNYQVVVTNKHGSVTSSNAVLIVLIPASITIQPADRVIAVGSNATLSVIATGTAPLSYQWMRNGTLLTNDSRVSGVTGGSLVISNAQTADSGSYSVMVSNSIGAITSAAAALSVIYPPTIFLQSPGETNFTGGTLVLQVFANGTPPFGHQWFFNGTPLTNDSRISGATDYYLFISGLQTNDTGEYVAVITNGAGSVTSSVMNVSVSFSPPIFDQQPQSQTNVVNVGNINFSTEVRGSSPLSYQWFFNGSPLVNSTQNNFSKQYPQTNDAGNYWLVASNGVGVTTSTVAQLTILVPPSITIGTTNQTFVAGLSGGFSVAAAGSEPLSYQWYFNSTKLVDDARHTGSTTNALNISNVLTSDAGYYYVVVTNRAGSITSGATATVILSPSITIQPTGRSVPVGLPTIFSAAASATAPINYQWQLNGTNISGATNNSYTNSALTINDFGAYQLVVTNAGGTATSSVAMLTRGSVAAWGNNSSGQALPPPGLSNVVAVAGGSTFSFALKEDGTVSAWGSGAGTNIPVGLSNIVAIAAGSTFGLGVRADGNVVSWGSSNGTNVSASVSNIVLVSGSSGHGMGLRGEGTLVEWGTSGSKTVPVGLTRIAAISDGVSFGLAARTDGTVVAWGSLSLPSFINPNPPASVSNVISVAAGLNHALALKSDGRVVAWGSGTTVTNVPANLTNVVAIAANSFEQTTAYSLALRSNGLVAGWGANNLVLTNIPSGLSNIVAIAAGATHSLALVSDGTPLIIRQPVGGTAFSSNQFMLSATVSGQTPLTYAWSFNGTNIPGATNTSFVISNAQAANTGIYQFTSINALGSATSVPAPVTVLDGAPAILSIPTNRIIYFAAPLLIESIVTGSQPLQFQWLLNGTNIPGATNNNLFIAGTNVNAGNYTLLVSNMFGSVNSNVAVKILGPVVAWGSSSSPTNVPASASNAIAIAAGYWVNGSDIALKADGTIVSWNSAGNINLPAGLSNVMEIASGYYPSNGLALKTNGTVTGWGNVNSTFLNTLSNVVSVEMHDGGSTFLRTDGSVSRLNFNGITNQPGLSNVVLLAPFNYGYLALRADGTVFMDSQGFGPVPTSNNVMAMAAGGYRAGQGLLLRRDGSLVTWGQPTNVPPIGPNCLGVAASSYGKFAIRSDGTIAAWSASSADASTNLPVGLANVSVIDAGEQHAIALLTDRNFPPVYLSDALNTPALVVSSKGSSQWFGQTNVNHDGLHAAQSGPVGSGTASSMRMWVTGPITVSFWWKVSSETNHDFLTFSAGGVILTNISGETGWRQCTLATPPGNQILQWTYSKDGNLSAGQDSAWVDQLVITPIAPSILTQPVGTNVLGGNNVAFNVSATGTPPLSYRWRKDAATIPGNVTASLALLNVTRSNSGIYSVVVTNIAGSTTSSNATLRVLVPQLLSQPMLQPDGTIMFNSVDADGGILSPADLVNLQVQASSNLVDWVSLSGALTLTNGALQLQDSNSTNFPARYYRIVEQ
ncbi:MAG: immunoglobulin domain-containing protein [Verrucomicrobiota bacterium]